jgi:Ser/Thr protein kinase RdoA (MazF antagonist)
MKDGIMIASDMDRYFELSEWLPGAADFWDRPSPMRLQAAMRALAKLHLAWRGTASPTSETPACVERRRRYLDSLLSGELQSIKLALENDDRDALDTYVHRDIALDVLRIAWSAVPSLAQALDSARSLTVTQQYCLRDIWHDHVLFTDDVVTGVVDFDAVGMDSVSTDLARLVGSLIGDDPVRWEAAIAAYAELRSLNENERQLISVIDRANVVLTGLQWLSWLYIERRPFGAKSRVRQRITAIHERLTRMRP